jgi:hypothetical protein
VSRWRRFCFLLGRRHDLFGIEVRVLLADRAELEIVLVKLREAFDLLRTYDSRRFAQLRKGVRYIWVGATHNTAEYWVDLNMCVLQFDYVLSAKTSAAALAQTLAHEAMHARLHRLGFGYEEHERVRIERICVGRRSILSSDSRAKPHWSQMLKGALPMELMFGLIRSSTAEGSGHLGDLDGQAELATSSGGLSDG